MELYNVFQMGIEQAVGRHRGHGWAQRFWSMRRAGLGFVVMVGHLTVSQNQCASFHDESLMLIHGKTESRRKNMSKPTIEQYLISTCLFTIDQFDEMYLTESQDDLKPIANNTYNEMDITVKLGLPFGLLAHYTTATGKGEAKPEAAPGFKTNHDIHVPSKDFQIEVKYLRTWDKPTGNKATSGNWSRFQLDMDWLIHEIKSGKKGNRAVVLGWFNCVDNFSSLMQIGMKKGRYPDADERKICYLPFLKKAKVPTKTTDMGCNYSLAYKPLPLNLIGTDRTDCDCLFLGNPDNKFHFAIYY